MKEKTYTLDDFDYILDPQLIAQHPLKDRAMSKLMVVDKKTGLYEENYFSNIINYLNKGDTLVINDSKVMPARLFGQLETGGKMEILLLEEIEKDIWEVLVNPGKKAKEGRTITFEKDKVTMKAKVVNRLETGNRWLEFSYDGDFRKLLGVLGDMPLPPYITERLLDKDRYQTVYAKDFGSAAAPTAGLHFTKDLLNKIYDKGVNIATITLHVGLGTFRPVAESIETHTMHKEKYSISEETASILNETKKNGKKIIAVGTTSARTLEAAIGVDGTFYPMRAETELFILPGYKFQAIDGLITNFHLPKSTLLMLVSAFSSRDIMMECYEKAIAKGYRFFSFGDAMLIGDF